MNPKKGAGLIDHDLSIDNDNAHAASVYGSTPPRFSVNLWGDTVSMDRVNTKESPENGGKKKVATVNLNIEGDKKQKESKCGCA